MADSGEIGGFVFTVSVYSALIWWSSQPPKDAVCVTERHWWIGGDKPTCASEIGKLDERVAALEEKLHTND